MKNFFKSSTVLRVGIWAPYENWMIPFWNHGLGCNPKLLPRLPGFTKGKTTSTTRTVPTKILFLKQVIRSKAPLTPWIYTLTEYIRSRSSLISELKEMEETWVFEKKIFIACSASSDWLFCCRKSKMSRNEEKMKDWKLMESLSNARGSRKNWKTHLVRKMFGGFSKYWGPRLFMSDLTNSIDLREL